MLRLTKSTDNELLESPFLTPRAYFNEMKSIFNEITTSIVFWRNIIIVRFSILVENIIVLLCIYI